MFLTLAIVLSAPPTYTVENLCPPAYKVTNLCPAPAVETKAVTTKVAAPGWHVHRCANGHEWSHTNASKGSVAEHTCPVCGLQDWTPRQLDTRIVTTQAPVTKAESAPTFSLPSFTGSTCPGGVCPPQSHGLFGIRRK